MSPSVRGSRKHVLDWVEIPDFNAELAALLGLPGLVVRDRSYRPRGHFDPAETTLDEFGPEFIAGSLDWDELADWWLAVRERANTPNWDIAAVCDQGERTSIVLVEAKANHPELKSEGKSPPNPRSENSKRNHERIGRAIDEARAALSSRFPGIGISRDSHYQLSNRVAFAWKLASMGLPVVLVYLGFVGDTGIRDVGAPSRSDHDWQEAFRRHSKGVIPEGFTEQAIECGPAEMRLLVRSRSVVEPSPLRAGNE